MGYLHTDKFPQLFYRKTGSGPALMLVHGFPENGELWDVIVPELAKSFTVITPDLPGSGQSSFTGELTIEVMADSLYEILAHEQVEELVMAGHSMGGYTTLAFAEKYGHMLAGFSLVHSMAIADSEEKKETRRKTIELIAKGGREVFIRQMIPNLFAKSFKEAHPELMARQIERGMKLAPENLIAFYKAMINRPERTATLQHTGSPVQWIIGAEDSVAPPEKVAEQCDKSDICFLSLYNDCGHMSMLEQPELLTADLKKFTLYCFDNA